MAEAPVLNKANAVLAGPAGASFGASLAGAAAKESPVSFRFCFSSYSFLTLSISDCGTLVVDAPAAAAAVVGEAGADDAGVAAPDAGAGRANCR